MQQLDDMERIFREKSAKAKHDLIGTIFNSELLHLLGYDGVDSEDMEKAWEQIEAFLQSKVEHQSQDDISCLITAYGNCQEEMGFREGFHVAMRLCMEGMRGGVF